MVQNIEATKSHMWPVKTQTNLRIRAFWSEFSHPRADIQQTSDEPQHDKTNQRTSCPITLTRDLSLSLLNILLKPYSPCRTNMWKEANLILLQNKEKPDDHLLRKSADFLVFHLFCFTLCHLYCICFFVVWCLGQNVEKSLWCQIYTYSSYSPGARANNLVGSKFLFQQKGFITLPICCKF